MIVVRVELHSANSNEVKEIARMDIRNHAGLAADAKADYLVKTLRGRTRKEHNAGVVQRTGYVENYPRKRLHVWNLVLRAILSCGYDAPAPVKGA